MTVPNVAEAVEAVASHLHPTPSWEVGDHPMPTGREEVWRFTLIIFGVMLTAHLIQFFLQLFDIF